LAERKVGIVKKERARKRPEKGRESGEGGKKTPKGN